MLPSSKAVSVSEENSSSLTHRLLKPFPWEARVMVLLPFITSAGLPTSPLGQTCSHCTISFTRHSFSKKKKTKKKLRHKDERTPSSTSPSVLPTQELEVRLRGDVFACCGVAFPALPESEDTSHICRRQWPGTQAIPSPLCARKTVCGFIVAVV